MTVVHFSDGDDPDDRAACGVSLEAPESDHEVTSGPRYALHWDKVTCPDCLRSEAAQQQEDFDQWAPLVGPLQRRIEASSATRSHLAEALAVTLIGMNAGDAARAETAFDGIMAAFRERERSS